MKVNVPYFYMEGYLPSNRHRKLRYREVKAEFEVTLNEVTKEEAPIAFLVHEMLHGTEEFRWWNQKLWKPLKWTDRQANASKDPYPVKELLSGLETISSYKDRKTKEEAEFEKLEYASIHLIIDGMVYEEAGEPRYVVMTFGLSNNHGGTSMFVKEFYNSNIRNDRYFTALERDKAIATGKALANGRGDTKSVDHIGEYCNIEVLIPEAVRCKPMAEHGEGNDFLNTIEAVTMGTSSTLEAGLLSMAVLAQELEERA